jgi:hypothetical protein
VGILPPTKIIDEAMEEITIDEVRMVFQNTPGSEAPAEMNTWFPDFKAFWALRRTSPAPCITSSRCAVHRCAMRSPGHSTSTRPCTASGICSDSGDAAMIHGTRISRPPSLRCLFAMPSLKEHIVTCKRVVTFNIRH